LPEDVLVTDGEACKLVRELTREMARESNIAAKTSSDTNSNTVSNTVESDGSENSSTGIDFDDDDEGFGDDGANRNELLSTFDDPDFRGLFRKLGLKKEFVVGIDDSEYSEDLDADEPKNP
jgi:hypothetical protein